MSADKEKKEFKLNDRVKRSAIAGCYGTVKEVKAETGAASNEAREKNLMVNVQWDNGTVSYVTPESLERAPADA